MRENFVNSCADLRHFLFHANLTKMAPVRVDRRPVLMVTCILFFCFVWLKYEIYYIYMYYVNQS